MINFFSSWAEQIILAVVIATIIELILPNNKNKKYIQMVIGIYILFNIISPIIKSKENISFEKYNTSKETSVQSEYTIDQTSMDKRLEKIYIDELEKSVKKRFEENGFIVNKCIIDAVLDTKKKNAGIHLITVKIKNPVNEESVQTIKKDLAQEFEIDEDKIKIIIT